MPQSTDLEIWGPVGTNLIEDDSSTVGGAINADGTGSVPGWRPFEVHITGSPTAIKLTATAGDTGSVTVKGRLASGAIDTEAITLTGATPAVSTKTYERLLKVYRATPHATYAVSIARNDNSAVLGTIAATEKGRFCMFIKSASAAGAVVREEKLFARNKAADAGIDATIKLTADPESAIRIGLSATKGDSATIANRLASFGVSLYDDNVSINVPTGTLGAGENIGLIVEESLSGGHGPIKNTFTIEIGCTSIT